MAQAVQFPAKPRRDYIDALKGLGIILVVWGHFMEYYRGTAFIFNAAWECIYVFHMSMFCLCSGMVARFKPGKLIFQQVWLYLLVQAGFLWFRIHVLLEELDGPDLMMEWLMPWRHMWYLYALILWELTVPLLCLARDKGRLPGTLAAAAAVLAVGLLGGRRNWPYSLNRVVAFFPMFAFGVLFSRYIDKGYQAVKRWWWLQLAAAAAFAAVYLPWFLSVLNAPEAVYEGKRLFNETAYSGSYTMRTRFVLYLLGILTTALLILILGRSKLLVSLGKRTLPVYIMHMAVYAYLSCLHIFDQPNLFGTVAVGAWLVISVGGCVSFFASAPVCLVFNAITNVWYRGVPALFRWVKDKIK